MTLIAPEILGLPQKLDPYLTRDKAQWTKTFQDFTSVVNSSVVCLFNTFALGVSDYAGLLSAITGWDLSDNEVLTIGERVTNIERLMNNRYGADGEQDTLPARFLEEPMPDGPAKGQISHLSEMLPEYYAVRGWENGRPTKDKLKELGLS